MSVYDKLNQLKKRPSNQTTLTNMKGSNKVTSTPTQKLASTRQISSDKSRESSRDKMRELPTRDEIQEFSFRLRDELKVKVQAEVPHQWQKELEDVARKLNVKKLELYRFILGEFLGKVSRKQTT